MNPAHFFPRGLLRLQNTISPRYTHTSVCVTYTSTNVADNKGERVCLPNAARSRVHDLLTECLLVRPPMPQLTRRNALLWSLLGVSV